MPGVHIGDGAIIGTNSTVASNIPPYCVAVGNPARVVRKRFDDETIELLERLRWWDKPIEEIDALLLGSYKSGFRRDENIFPKIYRQEITYVLHINRERQTDR